MIWCCRAAPMTRTWWSCSTPSSCPWRDNDEQYHLCSCSWRDNDKDSFLCSCSWRDNDEGHRLPLCSWRDKDKDHLLYDSWLFAQLTVHVHDGTMMLTIASTVWFMITCSTHCSCPWRDNDVDHRLYDSWLFAQITVQVHDGTMMKSIVSVIHDEMLIHILPGIKFTCLQQSSLQYLHEDFNIIIFQDFHLHDCYCD